MLVLPDQNATCEIYIGAERMHVRYLCERSKDKSPVQISVLHFQREKLFLQSSVNSHRAVIGPKKNGMKKMSAH